MTLVKIDIRNVASETHPDDKVLIRSATLREASGGGLISTAETIIHLVDGVGEVELAPGSVVVNFQCRGISDTSAKSGSVPDEGTVDIAEVIEEGLTFTPPVVNRSLDLIRSERDHLLTDMETTVSEAVGGQLGTAVRSAQSAAATAAQAATSADARATSAESTVNSYTPRVVALEAMNGVSPESPVDGQTANLLLQPESLSRAALNQSYVSNDLTVSVADPRFGAVADWDGTTGTDNTAAIRAAIAHARTLGTGAVVLYPQGTGRGYYVSETIEHGPDLSVDMRVPIYHPGGSVVVRFGSASRVTDTTASYTIRVRRTTNSNWEDPQDVGFEMVNISRCTINVPEVRGFTTNIRFVGDGQGFVVCTTTLGLILNCRTGIEMYAKDGGWVNSNLVLGGYFLNHVGLNVGKPRCAVRYTSNWGYYNDGNIFDGLVAELKVADAQGAEVEVIRAEYAQSNQHLNMRQETSGPVTIRNLNDSRFNNASLSYVQQTVRGGMDNTQAFRDTGKVTVLSGIDRESATRSVFRSDEMQTRAACYNGSSSIHIPGITWRVSGHANMSRSMTGVQLVGEYVRITSDRAAGVFVSTRTVKRLLLAAHTAEGNPGRWTVLAFDSDGTQLTDPRHVRRGAVAGMTHREYFGGAWITDLGNFSPFDFTVTDEVDYVWVGISGDAGAPALVSAIEVFTNVVHKTRAWQPWDDRGMNWGTTYPQEGAIGTYEVGRTIMNAAPAPGQPLGWVCTTAGSPGTWTPMQCLPSPQSPN